MANYFGGYPQPQQYQQYQQPNNNVIVVPVQGESGASKITNKIPFIK